MVGRALLGGGRVHPEGPPAVPVEIFERAAVHEAMVLGIVRFAAARGDRGFGDRVHIGAAVERQGVERAAGRMRVGDLFGRSEEHTSELQSLMRISYAVFCLKKKNKHMTRMTLL